MITKQKREIQEILSLQEFIDLESKRLAHEEFLNTIDKLSDDKDDLDNMIKSLTREINALKKDQKDRKLDINKRFYEILSDINLRFGSTKLSEVEFFSFSEVKGSGMDNNKTLLALYLTYMRLIAEYGVYSVPFGIDSFVKNEIDKETVKVTFKEVEKYFLTIPNQTFFVTISENLQYLSMLDKYHVLKLSNPILNKKSYSKLFSEVSTNN